MKCPNCNLQNFAIRSGSGMDADTGYYDEDFVVCVDCGTSFDFDELEVSNGTRNTQTSDAGVTR